MNVIKCDHCKKEMTEGNDFYTLTVSSIGMFTNYSSHNHGQPLVRHFCNDECLSGWSTGNVDRVRRVIEWANGKK
ncbi:hypothetical protein COD66_23330 [Bacillus cereus]|nr:hypothetical protein COD66_23330 [Bacillus cereus]